MRRLLFVGALILAVSLAIFGWRNFGSSSLETLTESKIRPPEAAPLCPWREPEADLKAFFPEATRYQVETRILSGLRPELTERLGRSPTGDENALRVYRAYRSETPLGSILTRRVKGEYGAIELVLATDMNRSVRGVRLQRLREPDSIASALENTNWLNSFVGKRAEDPLRLGADLPNVPAEAKGSAGALVDGVKSLLILCATADQGQVPTPAETHHH
jgi:hypothetical protein